MLRPGHGFWNLYGVCLDRIDLDSTPSHTHDFLTALDACNAEPLSFLTIFPIFPIFPAFISCGRLSVGGLVKH